MKKKEEIVEEVVEVVEAEPEPNVAFAGKEMRKDETGKMKLLPSLEAPKKINTATRTIHLPDSEVQVSAGATGFYHKEANWLINNFKDPGKTEGVFYKKPVGKGE